MKEIKARRMRFLAMLLGLIVFINVPAISAYAATVNMGNLSNLASNYGAQLNPGDTITWELRKSSNYGYMVEYRDAKGTLLARDEKNTSVAAPDSAAAVTYTVRSLTSLNGNAPKGEPLYWILSRVDSTDDFPVERIMLTAHYEETPSGDWTHEHHYEWVVTREATEDEGGEEAYMCECGAVLYRAPISAAGVFIKNTINKIINAKPGETVEITTEKWLTFNKDVADALSTRPDITLKINYREEGHKGPRLSTTLPKGTDLHKYLNDEGYVGFLYLRTLFPTTPYIPKQ